MWVSLLDELPINNKIVLTKIEDSFGCRMKQRLFRQNNLWFLEDSSMYVYYIPTHWWKD